MKLLTSWLLLTLWLVWQPVQAQDLMSFLEAIPGAEFRATDIPHNQYTTAYLILFEQPIDHANPGMGSFKQRIWLSHIDPNAPMVLVTEGYTATSNYASEPAKLLKANQLVVEHRYFDVSTPAQTPWKWLTVEQAANDHHRIVETFKKYYKGKWLNTGISKGGSTTLFHRAFFPDDVDVSMPYVAPLNFAREDARLFDFFHVVSTAEHREAMLDFQRRVLEKRAELLPLMQAYTQARGLSFAMGYDKAFELAVLEYPFASWQWGVSPTSIPDQQASVRVLFEHLMMASDPEYVSDQSTQSLKSFFYQAYTELGYYAYVPGALKPLLRGWQADTISSSVLIEGGDTLSFRPQTMQAVLSKLRAANPRMIVISGENDPWGATRVESADWSNTLQIVKPEGCHRTRVGNLPQHQKEQVYAALRRWMLSPITQP